MRRTALAAALRVALSAAALAPLPAVGQGGDVFMSDDAPSAKQSCLQGCTMKTVPSCRARDYGACRKDMSACRNKCYGDLKPLTPRLDTSGGDAGAATGGSPGAGTLVLQKPRLDTSQDPFKLKASENAVADFSYPSPTMVGGAQTGAPGTQTGGAATGGAQAGGTQGGPASTAPRKLRGTLHYSGYPIDVTIDSHFPLNLYAEAILKPGKQGRYFTRMGGSLVQAPSGSKPGLFKITQLWTDAASPQTVNLVVAVR